MVLCNPMSCSGFGMNIFGGCSMFWIAAVVLFFVIILSKKWIAELINMPWSNIGAFGLGYLVLIIIGVLSCSYKYALLGGILACYIGAYFGSYLDGSGGGGY